MTGLPSGSTSPVALPQSIGWAIGLPLLAVVCGLGSALWMARHAPANGIHVGAWHASLLAGSERADRYTRARIAVGGLLALNRAETLYYLATTDTTGTPLHARCHYRVSGVPLPARWWSITAYADDLYLFPNAMHRYSVNQATARVSQGRFSLETGPLPPKDTAMLWLPTPGDSGLVLTLRLSQPESGWQQAPADLAAPLIERIGACT